MTETKREVCPPTIDSITLPPDIVRIGDKSPKDYSQRDIEALNGWQP
jgi:hypothetical protein